jgi:hypothetical protein
MVRKTMKMLVVALVAAFALSSMAEAATPKKTRHRVKHSSRVASGAAATTGKKPAAKKKTAPRARAKAGTTAHKSTTKKAPAKRRPTTKPR